MRYHRWADEDLALAFRAGDPAAGEALLERYRRLVYAIASRYGASSNDVEDLYTEVWLKLQQQIPGYKPKESFRGYLRTVIRSVVVDHRRREGRHEDHRSLDTPDDEDAPALADQLADDTDLEQGLLDAEQLDLVQRAVRQLPDRFREPLLLYYREGLGHEAIGAQLGVPKNTVTTRIHRGREQVRRQVERWLAQ